MEYSIVGCLLYGLITGFSEFLPVSTLANQYLFSYLTGFSNNTAFILFMSYLGSLVAVVVYCWKHLVHIRRELHLASLPKHRRKRLPDIQAVSDFRLMVIAFVPIFLGVLFYNASVSFFTKLPLICLVLILSGVFVYLPHYLPSGFRNSKNLTPMDGVVMGLCSALSVIPGISRMGLVLYVGRSRGCDRESMLNLALLLSIPMLLALVIFHLFCMIFAAGATITAIGFLAGFLCALASFGGGVAAIYIARFLAVKRGFSGFSFYCWGMAVFCFIFYLIT